MFDVVTYYLSNGMRIMLHREKGTRVVKTGVIVNQGSMHEEDKSNGISHFIEHMIFAQYENNLDIQSYVNDLYSFGAKYNATTYKANTMYYISGLSDGVETYLRILKDLVFKPKPFEITTLNREKSVVERELVSFYSSFNQISDRSLQALFGERGIGRIIVGKKENIKNFTLDQINEKVKNTYTPENSALVVFGDIDYYEMQKLIEDLFGELDDIKTIQHHENVQQSPSIYFNPNYKGEHSIVSVCYRKITNENSALMENVLALLLCSLCDPTLSNRIAYRLRMDTGLSYKVGGFIKTLNEFYASGITAVAKNIDIPEVVKIMIQNLNEIRETGFSDDELLRVKKNIIYQKLAARNDMSTQADLLLNMSMKPMIYSPENEIRIIEKLSRDDVNRCVYDLLNPDNFGLACIGNCNIDQAIKEFSF
ncbi:M16 family metallopeptidase [Clostridium tunisiense]|uniref:M16 family metallopeptidase n=1 Tax=Clostridium tunisiense TaxID=219748 RepID=UPI0002EBE61C|nr:pitrilysin family protein [Clostridium tunisiense]